MIIKEENKMITKFVVRKSYRNSSVKVRCYDSLAEAIEDAKTIYKSGAKLRGFEVVVEESRFADEKRLLQDFAIDRHIRWASYFHEL